MSKYLQIFVNDQRICGCEVQTDKWNADPDKVIEEVLAGISGAFLRAKDLKKEDVVIQDLNKLNITYQIRDLEEGKMVESFRVPDGFWKKVVKTIKGVIVK